MCEKCDESEMNLFKKKIKERYKTVSPASIDAFRELTKEKITELKERYLSIGTEALAHYQLMVDVEAESNMKKTVTDAISKMKSVASSSVSFDDPLNKLELDLGDPKKDEKPN